VETIFEFVYEMHLKCCSLVLLKLAHVAKNVVGEMGRFLDINGRILPRERERERERDTKPLIAIFALLRNERFF
jgi:hypothetical protein